MGGGTTSSSSENRPLTAAERQDIYRSSIGNILNTYSQSGLPNDPGSMNRGSGMNPVSPQNYSPSQVYNGSPQVYNPSPWSSALQPTGETVLYNSSGNATRDNNTSGMKSLNPFGLADSPNTSMPTGAPDPGGINFPIYNAPTYSGPGKVNTLTGGDYDKLQSDILRGSTAGLDYAKAQDIKSINDDAAKRGIWSSGLVDQAIKDREVGYAPSYAKAGGDATTQRYVLQSGENQGANQFALSSSGLENQFNQTNAQNRFSSGWAPLNYLSSIYSGTAGNVGGTNTFGANLSI